MTNLSDEELTLVAQSAFDPELFKVKAYQEGRGVVFIDFEDEGFINDEGFIDFEDEGFINDEVPLSSLNKLSGLFPGKLYVLSASLDPDRSAIWIQIVLD